MYKFEYEIRSGAYLYGTQKDGIGIYQENSKWGFNIVLGDRINFYFGDVDFNKTKKMAIEEYERLKKELT